MGLDNLQDAEKQASVQPDGISDLDDARSAEEPDTNFSSNVTGRKSPNFKNRFSAKSFLRSKGPIGFVFAIILSVMSLLGVSQGLFGVSYIENLIQDYNSIHTSQSKRFKFFRRYLLSNKSDHPDAEIFSGKKTRYSKRLRSKLQQQGIEYDEIDLGNGKVTPVLLYEDPDNPGKKIAVTGSPDDAVPAAYRKKKGVRFAQTIDEAMQRPHFSNKFTAGSQSAKGHVAGWFDSLSTNFHRRIKNSRNRYRNLDKKAKPEEIAEASKKTGLPAEVADTDASKATTDEEDADGNKKPLFGADEDSSDALKLGMDDNAIEKALKNRAKKLAGGGMIACMGMRALGGINMAMSAIQVAQVLNFGSGVFESIHKMKSGDGGNEYSYFMNQLSKKGDTTGVKEDGTLGVVRKGTSSIASPAVQTVFSKTPLPAGDPVAKRFNRDSFAEISTKNAIGSYAGAFATKIGELGTASEAYSACNYATIGMSIVPLATLAASFFTGGASVLASQIFKFSKLTIVMLGIGPLISILTPHVARWLAMDLFAKTAGEDAAYALKSAANLYFGGQHQASSGAAGTMEALKENIAATQEIIAEDAAYDRAMRSPLDPTSNHTFLGSLLRQFMSVGLSSSVISSLSNTSSLVTSSLGNLSPLVGATGDGAKLHLQAKTDCPSLSVFGLVGDAFCNKYTTTDMSTINMDPYDVYTSVGEENFDGTDENGNPKIKEGSDFSKYIVACTLRESQIGVVDANVQSFVAKSTDTGNSNLSMAVQTGLNAIPIVDDVLNAAEAIENQHNLKWNSGQACVQDPSGQHNPDWQKNKYFQRYSEDQRLMETAGIIERSSVTAFVEDYYKKHPLDTSHAGTIARYSGMTLAQANQALDTIAYIKSVVEYDPSDKFPHHTTPTLALNFRSSYAKPLPFFAPGATQRLVSLNLPGARVLFRPLRSRVVYV